MILHAFDFGSFHGDFAVIGAGKLGGEQKIDGLVAGNDSHRKIHWAKLVGDAIRAGAHLAAGWAVEPLEWRPATEAVDDFTALIGWAEHDGSAQAWNRMLAEILAQQNATHGVGDKMNRPVGWAFIQCGAKGFSGKGLNVLFGRRIALINHGITAFLQGRFHFLH